MHKKDTVYDLRFQGSPVGLGECPLHLRRVVGRAVLRPWVSVKREAA